MKLIKSKDGNIIFDGKKSYWYHEYKSVIVDGEVYEKTKCVDVTKHISEIRKEEKSKFYFNEWDFPMIDYKAKIENTTFFYGGITTNTIYSERNDINNLICAFKEGLLDPRIKKISIGKDHRNWKYEWDDIIDNMMVTIDIGGYGWNNSIYASFDLRDFIGFNPDSIADYRVKEVFKKNGIELGTELNYKQVLKLLTKKIQLT